MSLDLKPVDTTDESFINIWKQSREHIKDALKYSGDTHSDETVLQLILNGYAQLFIEGSTSIVTEIVEYPKNRVCRVWLAGGDIKEVHVLATKIEAWAKDQKCTDAEIIGRRGWKRALPDFIETSTVFKKKLT